MAQALTENIKYYAYVAYITIAVFRTCSRRLGRVKTNLSTKINQLRVKTV